MDDDSKKDIIPLKERLRKAEAAEAKFRGLLNYAPDAIVVVNSDGRIVLVNSQTERMFGYQREELLNQTVEMLMPERFRTAHMGHRAHSLSEPCTRAMGMGRNLFGQRKDGREFPVEIRLSPMETEDGTIVISVIRDITERKQAEDALREREEMFRQLAENIHEVFWMRSLDMSQMFYVSPAYEEVWGRTLQSLYEQPRSLLDAIHPDDRERVIAIIEKSIREHFSEEFRIVRPDGSVRWVWVRFSPFAFRLSPSAFRASCWV